MRRLIVLAAAALLLSSCGVSSLYYWGGTQSGATAYENLAYQSYDKQTPKSLCKLVALYEKIYIILPGRHHYNVLWSGLLFRLLWKSR